MPNQQEHSSHDSFKGIIYGKKSREFMYAHVTKTEYIYRFVRSEQDSISLYDQTIVKWNKKIY